MTNWHSLQCSSLFEGVPYNNKVYGKYDCTYHWQSDYKCRDV